MVTYREAGVNIVFGDTVSNMFYDVCKQSWKNRKGKLGEIFALFDDFRGIRGIDISQLPGGTIFGMGSDGIGTKVEIAERVGNHSTIAHDLLAMVCDDASRYGAEPFAVSSVLDTRKLEGNTALVRQMATGYLNAAQDANVGIIGGETAELGPRVNGYGEFNYNWGATVSWLAHKERLLDGRAIKEGDRVVAFKENGFRSNGLSLVRRIMESAHGPEWHQTFVGDSDNSLGQQVLTPSIIYTRALVDLCGGVFGEPKAKVQGIVHVTGGGIPSKLGSLLKATRLGAYLEDLFAPGPIMSYVQGIGKVDSRTAYSTWNMGQGVLVITPEPDKVISLASQYGIEAKDSGEITSTSSILIDPNINSDGEKQFKRNPILVFNEG